MVVERLEQCAGGCHIREASDLEWASVDAASAFESCLGELLAETQEVSGEAQPPTIGMDEGEVEDLERGLLVDVEIAEFHDAVGLVNQQQVSFGVPPGAVVPLGLFSGRPRNADLGAGRGIDDDGDGIRVVDRRGAQSETCWVGWCSWRESTLAGRHPMGKCRTSSVGKRQSPGASEGFLTMWVSGKGKGSVASSGKRTLRSRGFERRPETPNTVSGHRSDERCRNRVALGGSQDPGPAL